MKHLEGQPRLTKPFIRLVDKVTGRGDTTLLTHADRRELRTYDKQLKQEAKIEINEYRELLHRTGNEFIEQVRNDPKIPTHIEIEGNTYTMAEGFRAYIALRNRLDREAAARGDAEIDYSQLPWRPQPQRYEDLTPERQQYRNFTIARELHAHMAQEVQDAQFGRIAASIKTDVWNDTRKDHPLHAPVSSIQPTAQIDIQAKDDGTIINRSLVGVSISYTHKDVASEGEKKIVHFPQKEELTFGIGYFGDRGAIVPEAQTLVSDEELEKGVKAYYIQRSYTVAERGKAVRKTEIIVIPFAYEDSQHTFIKHLYTSAKSLAPETVLPQAIQRIKRSKRSADA